jgi:small subunit ribosomal protein S20
MKVATHKQAMKRHRQSLIRRDRNRRQRSMVKTAIRRLSEAAAEGTKDTTELLRAAFSRIAKARSKGLLHKNTAARMISRLATTYAK